MNLEKKKHYVVEVNMAISGKEREVERCVTSQNKIRTYDKIRF